MDRFLFKQRQMVLPGERIRRMKPSRFEPMNRMICEVFSLAPSGDHVTRSVRLLWGN
jgi:hypothetical protein